jgi:competence protein ComFC
MIHAPFLTNLVDHLYDGLLTLVYPYACAICSGSVEQREMIPACVNCWRATRIFTDKETLCWKCGVVARGLHSVDPTGVRCRRCDNQQFEAARACGVYEGALRESILLLKRQPFLSGELLKLLVSVAKRPPLNTATRIIPVPLHAERERQRGFNQAQLMAQAIAAQLRLVTDESNLIRVSPANKYRAGLDAKGRLDTVVNGFEVRKPTVVRGEIIILVDDVFTTGATATSCADALLQAGARTVFVLTAARPAW